MLWAIGLVLVNSGADAQPATDGDAINRHPLELQALTKPNHVIAIIPEKIKAAKQSDNVREQALLYLAWSNACRVIADWSCQIQTGNNALLVAQLANVPELQVRSLIMKSRGEMAIQIFSDAESSMGEAQRILERFPFPELEADVMLGYSSMMYTLNKAKLSADYAQRGLDALGDLPSPIIRARLYRNQSRALSLLGDDLAARRALGSAVAISQTLDDPKLLAELRLEDARIAHKLGDSKKELQNAAAILTLAQRMGNNQLLGLGHETLGMAALTTGDHQKALREFNHATLAFRAHNLIRDERRVLRLALASELKNPTSNIKQLGPKMTRLITLDTALEIDDKNLVLRNIESQLEYAQQQFRVKELEAESTLARERNAAAAARQKASNIMAALAIGLLIVLGVFSVSQRRSRQQIARTAAQITASEARFKAIANNLPALFAHVDKNLRYRFVNGNFAAFYGYSVEQILSMDMATVRGKDVLGILQPHIDTVLSGEPIVFRGQELVSGRHYHYQTHYVPDINELGDVCGFYSLTFDISTLKETEAELQRLTLTDSLTGVGNRRHFESRLDDSLARAQREDWSTALLCLDIDHFKNINDRYGHPVGDAVIVEFSRRLQLVLRTVDFLARLGGDEFVIILENTGIEGAETVAEKILHSLTEPMYIDSQEIRIGSSIGMAIGKHLITSAELFKQADQALYEAKKAGRNRASTLTI